MGEKHAPATVSLDVHLVKHLPRPGIGRVDLFEIFAIEVGDRVIASPTPHRKQHESRIVPAHAHTLLPGVNTNGVKFSGLAIPHKL